MKTTLDETREREFQEGKNLEKDVFFPETKSDNGECVYYYKCGPDVVRGCSNENNR